MLLRMACVLRRAFCAASDTAALSIHTTGLIAVPRPPEVVRVQVLRGRHARLELCRVSAFPTRPLWPSVLPCRVARPSYATHCFTKLLP